MLKPSRADLKKKLAEFPVDQRALESERVLAKFLIWVGQNKKFFSRIACYQPLSDELDVSMVWKSIADCELLFPRVHDADLHWVKIPSESVESHFAKGAFGILEPMPTLPALSQDELNLCSQQTLVLVPGLGFSKTGARLGRGKGFYDRALGKNPAWTRVALAYSFQIFDELEQNDWDQRMDLVIGPTGHWKGMR